MHDAVDDPVLAAQRLDLATWLSGRMLVKVDRASMAEGLEVRCPLLDPALLAWGMALPSGLKLHHGEGKYVFKRALEPLLPREVLYRPKQGFATSLAGLFRREAGQVRTQLARLRDCPLFRFPANEALLAAHEGGRADHAATIWLLLVFEGFLAAEAAGA
jgi:asparagine synthase (glutamine-hydrolysing)